MSHPHAGTTKPSNFQLCIMPASGKAHGFIANALSSCLLITYSFKKDLFLIMCSWLWVGIYPHECKSPQRPEEGIGSPGHRVTENYEQPCKCWDSNMGPPQDQPVNNLSSSLNELLTESQVLVLCGEEKVSQSREPPILGLQDG